MADGKFKNPPVADWRDTKRVLDQAQRVHLVGVGGIGMMAIAQYLVQTGRCISGCDNDALQAISRLAPLGVVVQSGHDPNHVKDMDLVVTTAAAGDENPEVAVANAAGTPVVKRAALLGAVVNAGRNICVAGTHGKSTTTALAGHLLRGAGIDATVFGGAFVREAGGSETGPALFSPGDNFVVEADEYDRSFFALQPEIAVVTSLDFDHPDCYADMGQLELAFTTFASRARRRIVAESAQNARGAFAEGGLEFETYSLEGNGDWVARDVAASGQVTEFTLHNPGFEPVRFKSRLLGMHNVENAVAAIAACCLFSGCSPSSFQRPLWEFHGLSRRLEFRGEEAGVMVVDDYAHHPVEVRASLQALATLGRPIRVIFQPHTYSRTASLMSDFASSFGQAMQVVLLPVYGAREDPTAGKSSDDLFPLLAAQHESASLEQSKDHAVQAVTEKACTGDLVVTMGAGDVNQLVPCIFESLRVAAHA